MRQPTAMTPPPPMMQRPMGPSGGPMPRTGGQMMGLQQNPQPRMDNTATNSPDMRGAIVQFLARNGFQGF